MKRYGLVLVTLATLLVTAVTLHAAGWLGPRAPHAHPPHSTGRQAALKAEEHSTAMPGYYRQGGPRHWRDCLGQN